jgi:hypothetical protein
MRKPRALKSDSGKIGTPDLRTTYQEIDVSEKSQYMTGYDNGYADAQRAEKERKAASMTAAARDVLTERRRQIEQEHIKPRLDDLYRHGQLAVAAGCYLLFSDAYPNAGEPPPQWPFANPWWKPKDYRRDVLRAAALALAELERIDRAAAK